MCCGSAHWKREEVPDHKFDFIDVRDFRDSGWFSQIKYTFLFLMVIKSFAVYVADIYTAITLLAFGHFSGSLYDKVQNDPDNNFRVPISYGRWIFTGCIIFSFLLLAYEAHKSRAIVKSRDISYAYTNVMANNYYSLRSYDHFCFFSQINDSKKKKDELAFFIFFTFKGWKRLLVADGPRQIINFFTLYGLGSFAKWSTNPYDYYEGNIMTGVMIISQLFTVAVFAGSVILLIIAALMYIPLLCYIKGNLKEYCCHKIDKRVTELVHRKKKQRLAKVAEITRKEAAGDFSHLMDKRGNVVGRAMPQPTLPKMDVDLLLRDEKLNGGGAMQRSTSIGSSTAAAGYLGAQPGYTSPGLGPAQFYGAHNPSASTLGFDKTEYGSSAHLVSNAGHAGGEADADRDRMEMLVDNMGPIGTSPLLYAQRVVPGSAGYAQDPYAQQQGSERSLLDPRLGMQHRPSFNSQRYPSPTPPYETGSGSARGSPYQQPQRIHGQHGQDLSQPDYAYGVEGRDYPPSASPNYGDQQDQREYYQPDSAAQYDDNERHLKVDHGSTNSRAQQPSPDPSLGGGGGGYEDLYDAYLHSSSHSPVVSADRRHSYMMTDYTGPQDTQQQQQWPDQHTQHDQQYYDERQHAGYGYDERQQASHGYDDRQQASHGYDDRQQASHGYDDRQQASHGYDDRQQASHGYDQQYYENGQADATAQHERQWTQQEVDEYYAAQEAEYHHSQKPYSHAHTQHSSNTHIY